MFKTYLNAGQCTLGNATKPNINTFFELESVVRFATIFTIRIDSLIII